MGKLIEMPGNRRCEKCRWVHATDDECRPEVLHGRLLIDTRRHPDFCAADMTGTKKATQRKEGEKQ